MDTFQLPPRKTLAELLAQEPALQKNKAVLPSETKAPRKAGTAWTEEEHLAFLEGLKKLGKGNWRGISRQYVPSRTSTQIASHAQKYMQRVSGATKRKSKFSDIEQQADAIMSDTRTQKVTVAMQERPLTSAPMGSTESESCKLQRHDLSPGSLLHKPTAVRASSSDSDLLQFAESLMSLKDQSCLRPSDTSAFTCTGQDKPPSVSPSPDFSSCSQQLEPTSGVSSIISQGVSS